MRDVFESVFSSVDAIIYRCKNDRDYTIEDLHGSVERILGYRPEDILNNAVVSWVQLTAKEDEARLFKEVDAAIEAGRSWDVAYRMRHAKGHFVWVRARGAAHFVDGELAYLEGLVVSADAEIALRKEIEEMLTQSRAENQQILALTEKVTTSQRQLTMLSVNARIEAARSGDMGRGFGVVADAINALAKQNGVWLAEVSAMLQRHSES